MSAIFPDSKTFVDMKLKHSEEYTLKAFEDFLKDLKTKNIPRNKLEKFVREHFDDVGSEFETWYPPDWHGNPKIFNKIIDPKMKKFAKKLHSMWKYLGRKIKKNVADNPNLYSMVYVPNAFIVPGGRFREFYYWDSYWIIKGLLYSEMYDTVKGMLINYLELVNKYGLVPNGGRIYYAGRSQPPLLIPMIYYYFKATGDTKFISQYLYLLEEEYAFWITNRTVKLKVDGVTYTLVRFNDETRGPRPESYREDHNAAHLMATEVEKEEYYAEMKAAAESGRDFSSRWFIFNAAYYQKQADTWNHAIQKVLWHEDVGCWLDWDLLNGKRRNYFYPSNLAPHLAEKILNYLQKFNLDDYPGGIPSSFETTGEQWDFPNIWSPLEDMVISGLDFLDDGRAKDFARNHAFKWIYTMYRGYSDTKAMYEKYDATVSGAPGGGGEYVNQIGFGWTNGVALDLLAKYADQILPPPKDWPSSADRPKLSFLCKIIIVVSIIVAFLKSF
ncbi:hypothetical protein L9F63_013471 [Diploptera punctata]|uniref:Trehalase n=1 Tax=Diploptera punctata TaxID=6984 RepID=A0AAD8AA41_DIPPU|nr:hypothetical protein L9F63_013471 [Diploptera punctata]